MASICGRGDKLGLKINLNGGNNNNNRHHYPECFFVFFCALLVCFVTHGVASL